MEHEHSPFSEPATPVGVGGSSGLATTSLAFVTAVRVKRRIRDVKLICLPAFYSNKGSFAVTSSETTEPNSRHARPCRPRHYACASLLMSINQVSTHSCLQIFIYGYYISSYTFPCEFFRVFPNFFSIPISFYAFF